jgi:hypothetical protein
MPCINITDAGLLKYPLLQQDVLLIHLVKFQDVPTLK